MTLSNIFFSMILGAILFYICACRGGLMNKQTRRVVRWAYGLIIAASICKILVFLPQAREWLPTAENFQDIGLIVLLWATRSRWRSAASKDLQRDAAG
jgi:hypothetical protein